MRSRSAVLGAIVAIVLVAGAVGSTARPSRAVGAYTWSTPSPFTTAPNAYDAQMAMSADGSTAVALWSLSSAGKITMQAATASIVGNTATWSAPADVSAPFDSVFLPYAVEMSADGSAAIAIWWASSGSGNVVQTATASVTDGVATWSTASNLTSSTDVSFAQIALSADGTTAMASFVDFSTPVNPRVRIASVSGGVATWGTEVGISNAEQAVNFSQVALSTDGKRAMVVWEGGDLDFNYINTATVSISGTVPTFSTPTNIAPASTYPKSPQLALSATGDHAVVVWTNSDGVSTRTVESATASIAGNVPTWSSATQLSTNGAIANDPQVAISADGTRAATVWRESGIRAATASISGGVATWSASTALSGDRSYVAHVALSADGTVASAAWMSTGLVIRSTTAAIVGTAATWAFPTDHATDGSTDPQFAMSADGTRITIVWGGYIESGSVASVYEGMESVSAAIFNPPGAPRDVAASPGDGEVTLSWSPPVSDGNSPITGYTVIAVPGGHKCTTSGATTCVVSGLENGTRYSFTVVAANEIGEGAASDAVTATPNAPSTSDPVAPVFTG